MQRASACGPNHNIIPIPGARHFSSATQAADGKKADGTDDSIFASADYFKDAQAEKIQVSDEYKDLVEEGVATINKTS